MPKITTYTSRSRLTTDGPGVTSNLQISPTATIAAKLLPAANQVTDFHIKKRDISEKLEANKIIQSVKGDIDLDIEKNKDNSNEEQVLNIIQNNFKNYKNNSLSTIKNKRIRERVENGLALEYPEFINTVKKNSYTALETQTTKVLNDNLNNIISKYSTTENFILKSKYKNQGIEEINNFAKDFQLSDFALKEKIKAFEKNLLSGDFVSFVGKDNAAKNITNLDASYGADKTLTNEEFAASVISAYDNKIAEITIVGDPDADFDEAIRLIEEARTINRVNGFKVDAGVTGKKLDELEQKIRGEKITHESTIQSRTLGLELNTYVDDQKKSLSGSFYNALDPERNKATDKDLSIEAETEFQERFDAYLVANRDATFFEKKSYARELKLLLLDKYEEVNIEEVSTFNLNQNKYNVVRSEQEILAAMTLYKEKPEEKNILKTLAKLNGYVDKDGKADVNAFFNVYFEILKNRKKG